MQDAAGISENMDRVPASCQINLKLSVREFPVGSAEKPASCNVCVTKAGVKEPDIALVFMSLVL